jgi:hypothetical protein
VTLARSANASLFAGFRRESRACPLCLKPR